VRKTVSNLKAERTDKGRLEKIESDVRKNQGPSSSMAAMVQPTPHENEGAKLQGGGRKNTFEGVLRRHRTMSRLPIAA
jgi:hypothetical protein